MSNYPIGFPQKFAGWKGKTLYQVVATIQKNVNKSSYVNPTQILKSMPLKIYRKEIHNINGEAKPKNCNVHISSKITDMDMPGSTIVTEIPHTYSNGLVNTIDIIQTTLSAENGSCNANNNCFSPTYNARKRVRSAGMIPKKFNMNNNNDTYNSSSQQYLTSRNKTIKQNEFHYIRKGNAGLIPGPGLASSNIYSPGGLSHCYQPFVSVSNNNNTFSYKWDVSGNITNYNVTIPDGKYDIFALDVAFKTAQYTNRTYLTSSTGNNIFLMNITYNTNTQMIALITNNINYNDNPTHAKPLGATWNWGTSVRIRSSITILNNNNFADLIGFLPGEYKDGVNYPFYDGYILPNYVPLYYKPNNPSFGVQGAVESSARIQRLKYNTITTGAFAIKSAYGTATSNALAYGVSEQAYTSKTSVGDKPKLTPVINPKNGNLCKKRFIYRK